MPCAGHMSTWAPSQCMGSAHRAPTGSSRNVAKATPVLVSLFLSRCHFHIPGSPPRGQLYELRLHKGLGARLGQLGGREPNSPVVDQHSAGPGTEAGVGGAVSSGRAQELHRGAAGLGISLLLCHSGPLPPLGGPTGLISHGLSPASHSLPSMAPDHPP